MEQPRRASQPSPPSDPTVGRRSPQQEIRQSQDCRCFGFGVFTRTFICKIHPQYSSSSGQLVPCR